MGIKGRQNTAMSISAGSQMLGAWMGGEYNAAEAKKKRERSVRERYMDMILGGALAQSQALEEGDQYSMNAMKTLMG